jgi:hypothetical protein
MMYRLKNFTRIRGLKNVFNYQCRNFLKAGSTVSKIVFGHC